MSQPAKTPADFGYSERKHGPWILQVADNLLVEFDSAECGRAICVEIKCSCDREVRWKQYGVDDGNLSFEVKAKDPKAGTYEIYSKRPGTMEVWMPNERSTPDEPTPPSPPGPSAPAESRQERNDAQSVGIPLEQDRAWLE